MLLIINYHYIRGVNLYNYPGIHPVSLSMFENQLTELSRHLNFIGIDELNKLVLSQNSLKRHYGLITFDDGLREQFEYAVPILDRLKIPAIFFINTLPLVSKLVLSVHKFHWLRATRPPGIFLSQISEILSRLGIDLTEQEVDDNLSSAQYLYDDLETRRLKYLINHKLPNSIRDKAVDFMFHQEQNEESYSKELYMNKSQICEIAQTHSIGSHTHRHQSLATLNLEQSRLELSESKSILEKITKKSINTISYPYGGPTTINDAVLQVAKSVGYKIGFTMERGFNSSLIEPLMLARISASDAPGGKKPLVDFTGDKLSITPPMQGKRIVEQN